MYEFLENVFIMKMINESGLAKLIRSWSWNPWLILISISILQTLVSQVQLKNKKVCGFKDTKEKLQIKT